MTGVIIIDLDLTRGFQKYMIHRVLGPKSPSRTPATMEDIKILLAFLIGVKDDWDWHLGLGYCLASVYLMLVPDMSLHVTLISLY